MSSQIINRCTLLIAATCLLHCGGDDKKGVVFTDLSTQIANAFCRYASQCPGEDQQGYVVVGGGSIDTCTKVIKRAFEAGGDWKPIEASVNAGRIKYSEQNASECLSQAATVCLPTDGVVDRLTNNTPACRNTFVGTLTEGKTCLISDECVDGLYCDKMTSDGCGVCKPQSAKAAACSAQSISEGICKASDDATSATCYAPMGGDAGTCYDVYLQSAVKEGEACGMVYGTDSTAKETPCVLGLACIKELTGSFCRAPIKTGELCTESKLCEMGSFCLTNEANEKRCIVVPVRNKEGEECATKGDVNASKGVCSAHLRLSCVDGVCKALAGDGGEGSSCDIQCDDCEAYICKEGLSCHADTRTCGAPKADGQACTDYWECASGDCKDAGDMGTCQAINMCI